MKVLLAAVMLSLAASARAPEEGPGQTPEPPRVLVEEQPGSPLRILSVATKWATPARTGVELYVTVENVGGKAVSAYATRDAAAGRPDEGPQGWRMCLLISAQSPGKALRPGRSEGRSTWTGYDPSARLRRVVDFVEFTDGSTWGEDLCGATRGLAAGRAGAREARRRLREVFEGGGADAVVESLKAMKVSPPEGLEDEWRRLNPPGPGVRHFGAGGPGRQEDGPPLTHPLDWWRGYVAGFDSYLERIRRAVQEWGETEVEHALGRPVDALEEGAR
jgi:hypothetical protein